LANDLDAEEVGVRPGGPGVDQVESLAKADLDFDGIVVAEQVAPDNRRGRRPARHVRQQVGGELLEGEFLAATHGPAVRRTGFPTCPTDGREASCGTSSGASRPRRTG